MQYKSKDIVDIPKNTKYVPVTIRMVDTVKNMAITDIEVIGNTKYAKIGDDVYLWDYVEGVVKPTKVLTAESYRMSDVYPESYMTMTEVPDELDISGLTSLNSMFSETHTEEFVDDDGYTVIHQPSGDGGCRAMIVAPMMDTSQITNMCQMFGGRAEYESFKTDPLSGEMIFKPNKTYTNACVSLKSIPQYNTSNVTDFCAMFYGCSSLENVPELDTSNGTNFVDMFYDCTSLPKVYPHTIKLNWEDINDWNAFSRMFAGSSVEEVTFAIEFPFGVEGWFDEMPNEQKETLLTFLDPKGTLKKITFTEADDIGITIDKDGCHHNSEHQ